MWTDGFIVLNAHEAADRRALYTRVLRDNKFQVWEASTVAEALRLAADCPNILLLSGSLPEADRLIAYRTSVYRQQSSFPILRLIDTGVAAGDLDECFEKGSDSVLTEAAGPLDLVSTIRLQLKLRDMEEKLHSDLSRQRLADQAVRDMEENYGALFRANPHAMWVYDLETLVFSDVNDAAIRRYGYSREELLSKTVDRIHLAGEFASLRKPMELGYKPLSCRHMKKDGTVIIAQMIPYPIKFLGRRSALVMAVDFAEGTHSESLYQMLVDSIPPSVLLIDESMHVVLANKNFLEKSRRSKADTLGKPLSEVFPAVILEELGLLSHIKEAFEIGRALHGQRLTYRAPGVPLRTYYYNVIPIAWSSHVERVLLVMDDVTEQLRLGEEIRRVERHLASVVESANEIVLSTDRAARISSWNSAAERITGYGLKEVQGQSLYDYFTENCRPALKLLFAEVEQRPTFQAVEYDVVTRGGCQIPASWVFSPLKDGTGATAGIVAVGRDLTERRKFEQQIRQAEKLAALGVMAGGIAHEIRTPLAIASSAAQFLMDPDISDEFGRDCARKIHLGMHRASAIIESLLRFAHPSTEMTLVNLSAVLQDAIVLASSQIRQHQIELIPQIPDISVDIIGSASLLGQVFLNIFLNSVKAMPNGGQLTVSIHRLSGKVEVRVSDTGCGIDPADINHIFDPFYTTAPPGKGTGLGLSISYSIVKQHLGSIEVESIVGKGSTFIVLLPQDKRLNGITVALGDANATKA